MVAIFWGSRNVERSGCQLGGRLHPRSTYAGPHNLTAVVVPRPLTPQLVKKQLLWLIAVGLLTLVAVAGMRIDRQTKNLYLTDDVGNVITDDVGNGFATGREHRWDLVIGGERVPLRRWTEGL